jgi:predicted alpha/beta hydrolase family esterase
LKRPLSIAFATEHSPNADVTQEERTRVVVYLFEETVRRIPEPVVLVGHSLGGLTTSAVAEDIPDQRAHGDRISAIAAPGRSP